MSWEQSDPPTAQDKKGRGGLAGLALLALAALARNCDDVGRVAARHVDDLAPAASYVDEVSRPLSHYVDEAGRSASQADELASQADSVPLPVEEAESSIVRDVAQEAGEEAVHELLETDDEEKDGG